MCIEIHTLYACYHKTYQNSHLCHIALRQPPSSENLLSSPINLPAPQPRIPPDFFPCKTKYATRRVTNGEVCRDCQRARRRERERVLVRSKRTPGEEGGMVTREGLEMGRSLSMPTHSEAKDKRLCSAPTLTSIVGERDQAPSSSTIEDSSAVQQLHRSFMRMSILGPLPTSTLLRSTSMPPPSELHSEQPPSNAEDDEGQVRTEQSERDAFSAKMSPVEKSLGDSSSMERNEERGSPRPDSLRAMTPVRDWAAWYAPALK